MPPRPSGAQPPPNPGPPPPRGITMLGAQQTGKTTFLAALQIALLRKPDLGWSLTGDNPGSTQALINFVNSMSHDHEFPKPTSAIENYRWSLEAELPKAVKEWHWWGFRRQNLYIQVPLELMDAPGESADGRLLGRALSDRLVENLARSAGIVLFFDPVSEFERGDAFVHSYGVLAQLRSQAARRGRLPHHLAVCITKFDEIRVLESAQKLRVVEYELAREEFPQVPEEYAAEFFNRLIRLSRSDNAGLIMPLLEQTFHKERVRFFVTSAIGFYLDPSVGVFDPDDYQNHIPGVPPEPDRIRGAIYPINVIEPVLWLGRNVARTAG